MISSNYCLNALYTFPSPTPVLLPPVGGRYLPQQSVDPVRGRVPEAATQVAVHDGGRRATGEPGQEPVRPLARLRPQSDRTETSATSRHGLRECERHSRLQR